MIILILLRLLFACNPVKHVPTGEHLLRSTKIVTADDGLSNKEMRNYIKQHPNRKIFGVARLYLGIYNLSNPEKNNGFNNWLRKIGEEPVVLNPALTDRSVRQLELFLRNKGFHEAVVTDTILYKRRKADVIYQVNFGQPRLINRIDFSSSELITDRSVRELVRENSTSSLISPGFRFDYELLQAERNRIRNNLLNNGFYGFAREYIYYLTDTLNKPYQADLTLGIKNPRDASADRNMPDFHPRFRIGEIRIVPDYDPVEYLSNPSGYLSEADSLDYEGVRILYRDELNYRPGLLHSSLLFAPGSLYSQEKVDQTLAAFSSLRNFKQIKFDFIQEGNRLDSIQNIDCLILLSPMTKQSYDLSLEGTYSSGNIGVAGNLIYKHKNLFRGAENFELRFKGAVEFLADAVEDFNRMVEFGIESRLETPRSWIPFTREKPGSHSRPHSGLNLSYNYQRRPDFTRTIANASFGYNWKLPLTRHQLSVLEINYVNVSEMSDRFRNLIQGTYVENSFRSHLVPAVNYTFTFSDQEISRDQSFFYLKLRPEFAGNLFYGIRSAGNQEMPEGGYQLFNTPVSQYTMGEIDLRYHWVLNQSNKLAFRLFTGVGYPYGNSDALPFEKKYFSGGATGIRAWQVRSLGPGSYQLPEDQKRLYPNQLGDIKLEFNLEYRFDLFWILKGALFLDAGNIWAISGSDDRPGALFEWNNFYHQVAVGTGLGIRADLSFFIGRLDLGIKLRDPGAEDGPIWIPGNRRFQIRDFVLNFGIGYPF